jgi:hypothetical protein
LPTTSEQSSPLRTLWQEQDLDVAGSNGPWLRVNDGRGGTGYLAPGSYRPWREWAAGRTVTGPVSEIRPNATVVIGGTTVTLYGVLPLEHLSSQQQDTVRASLRKLNDRAYGQSATCKPQTTQTYFCTVPFRNQGSPGGTDTDLARVLLSDGLALVDWVAIKMPVRPGGRMDISAYDTEYTNAVNQRIGAWR